MIRFLSFLFSVTMVFCNYSVENAFPNISFIDPVGIYHSGDGSDRLFILEQQGRIKVFENNPDVQNAQTFLILDL